MKIEYKIGDLFESIFSIKNLYSRKNKVIIPHIVNSIGCWGSGFVIPLGYEWPDVREQYINWYKTGYDFERFLPFELGKSQIIRVEKNIFVVNMIAQQGILTLDNPHPIDYTALSSCMSDVRELAHHLTTYFKCQIEIHAPAFGSCRSGGDWKNISALIKNLWLIDYIPTNIYTLNKQEQDNLKAQL